MDDPSSLLSQCNEGYRERAERKSDGGGSGVWKTGTEMLGVDECGDYAGEIPPCARKAAPVGMTPESEIRAE